MGQDGIPNEVRELVEGHITSAAQVELLLFLRDRPGRGFDAAGAGRELRIDAAQAEHLLAELARSGLVHPEEDGYVYAPRDPQLREAVDALAALYPSYRVAIVSLIFSRPVGRLRDYPSLRPRG